jgi:hypothetical protein
MSASRLEVVVFVECARAGRQRGAESSTLESTFEFALAGLRTSKSRVLRILE